METPLERLMGSPKLEIYRRQIESALREERLKREEFCARTHENFKAEFVVGQLPARGPLNDAETLGQCGRYTFGNDRRFC